MSHEPLDKWQTSGETDFDIEFPWCVQGWGAVCRFPNEACADAWIAAVRKERGRTF